MAILTPAGAADVLAAVRDALADQTPLEIFGGGSKRDLGRPFQAGRRLDMSRLAGIGLYEPDELVLGAKSGTKLSDIDEALRRNRQELAFEPPDLGPLLGQPAGIQTIGGVIAANLAGPRRIKAGAARDHFLGFHAVSGRGESFKSGGRVMKNVTGYDMSKLMAGSWGTLGVLTEVTVKVLPAAEKTRTVLVLGLDDAGAVRAMTAALHSSHDVSGAAHLPAALARGSSVSYVSGAGRAVTALRIEGPPVSVAARCEALKADLSRFGPVEELHSKNSAALWLELRDAAFHVKPPERPVWRISVPPAQGAAVAQAIARGGDARYFYDWGGGLIWLSVAALAPDAGEPAIRAALAQSGGHATLIRAPAELRARVPVFQPQAPALAALTSRVKDAFDPARILNPGRMYAGV